MAIDFLGVHADIIKITNTSAIITAKLLSSDATTLLSKQLDWRCSIKSLNNAAGGSYKIEAQSDSAEYNITGLTSGYSYLIKIYVVVSSNERYEAASMIITTLKNSTQDDTVESFSSVTAKNRVRKVFIKNKNNYNQVLLYNNSREADYGNSNSR